MTPFNTNDPRLNAVIGIVVSGIAEIFKQCMAVYGQSIPKTAEGITPQSTAIRPQDLPTGVKDYAGQIPPKEPDPNLPIDQSSLKIPTFAQLLNLYRECAIENYKKNFKPCERARNGVLTGFKKILERLKIPLDQPITVLTRKRIAELEDIGIREKKSRATIQGWRGNIKSITAKWAVLMYEDRGWHVPQYITQPFNMAQKKYEALPKESIKAIDEWIERLRQDPKKKEEFKFVWIMRNLAVRNGDVFRFKWSNFTDNGEKVRSAYIPNKTSKNSQRSATWDLPKEKWMEIGIYQGKPDEHVIKVSEKDRDEFQRALNKEIKQLLPPNRNKGLYELRKLSAHEAYLTGGRKAAVRKTGDSFDTLDTNYVDTSASDED